MPSKSKIQFVCSNCGYKLPRWQGKCPGCEEWNTLAEETVAMGLGAASTAGFPATKPVYLGDTGAKATAKSRIVSGIPEFDAVLGGGLVPGSLVLLGGDPGIGKSTLALQLAFDLFQKNIELLYVSGEESAEQIALRGQRLPGFGPLPVLAETDLEIVLGTLHQEKPAVAIIDSIQTMRSNQVSGVTGGVSQIAFATNSLLSLAKKEHITLLIIGHVTKEGMLAGPKTLEHMVDTVLYLEGERFSSLRLLRSTKNRFGSVGEVGVFDMHEDGLVAVANPSLLFLQERQQGLPGSCIAPIVEGNKVLLVEVQALVHKTAFGYPKRTTSGFDLNRLQLLCAVLEKVLHLPLHEQDVYVNLAGGFKSNERALDLAVVLAILSSYNNTALPDAMVAAGEIGLLGEVRMVSHLDQRLKELKKLGFEKAIYGGKLSAKYPNTDFQSCNHVGQLKKYLGK